MRSAAGLPLDQAARWADVAGFGTSDAEEGRGPRPGSPPAFCPEALRDRPGMPLAGFLNWLTSDEDREPLGAFRLVRRGGRVQPPAGPPPTATQGYLHAVAPGHGVPPAWRVPVTPDDELRSFSPSRGNY